LVRAFDGLTLGLELNCAWKGRRKSDTAPGAETDHNTSLLFTVCDDRVLTSLRVEATFRDISRVICDVKTGIGVVVEYGPNVKELEKTSLAIRARSQVSSGFGWW
jgi:hypothetical protein